MRKLLSRLITIVVFLCVTGSVGVPYLPKLSDNGYVPLQGVCSAPPSLFPRLCEQFPVLMKVPELVQQSTGLIEAGLPDFLTPFPAVNNSLIDSIVVKAAPLFL